MKTEFLDYEAVRSRIPMHLAVDAVRESFVALEAGEFEFPTRAALGQGSFLVMPVRHIPSESLMVKSLSLSFAGRLPSISGTVTWCDLGDRGQIVADAGAVTALRTGAVSGVATDLMAPTSASRAAILGAGLQGVDQVRGVLAVRDLSSVAVYDLNKERAAAMAETLSSEYPHVSFEVTPDASAAVRDADVVCCATTSRRPLFGARDVAGRVHINAIGAYRPDMHELAGDLFAEGVVVVDQREAALVESGEVIDAVAARVIGVNDLVELGEALTAGLPSRSGLSIFKSVGVASQDWAIANLLAQELGFATNRTRNSGYPSMKSQHAERNS